MERETTNIQVELISTESIGPQAMHLAPEGTTEVVSSYTHGIIRTQLGVFALCSEGVGSDSPITDENRYPIDLYANGERDGTRYIGMVPIATANLTQANLEGLLTGEMVELGLFIRAHNSRLETNFRSWVRAITLASPRN